MAFLFAKICKRVSLSSPNRGPLPEIGKMELPLCVKQYFVHTHVSDKNSEFISE